MKAGPAAICPGRVVHDRTVPRRHRFTRDVSYVWLDPDRPEELTSAHRWWSHQRPAPARFRPSDYGPLDRPIDSFGEFVRDEIEPVLGYRPEGPIRMLTQVRMWGWLFNPITVYVVWHADENVPVAALLEVTNTPWKERHHYPVPLAADGEGWRTSTDKAMHVSPFLEQHYRYDVTLHGGVEPLDAVRLRIDVHPIDQTDPSAPPVLRTALRVARKPPGSDTLGQALRRFGSTHRVSIGIHVEAARLWLKRVPFVVHPKKQHDDEHPHD